MVEFILTGVVPSKKNARRLFSQNGRMVSAPSNQHRRWHRGAQLELAPQLGGMIIPISAEPVYIAYKFTMPDMIRRDLSNMMQSIEDLFVDMGILTDDSWRYLQLAGAVAKKSEGKTAIVEVAIEDEIGPLQKWLLTLQKS